MAGVQPVQAPDFAAAIAGGGPQIGMWLVSGSAAVAEICAGSGIDWLLIDCEHAVNDLHSVVDQLRAVSAYPVAVVVRPPSDDPIVIKRLLDVGVRNLLIPMVESAAQAQDLVRATRYPPHGFRGVGSAFARASQWNRVDGYLQSADEGISLFLQVESRAGLDALDEIAAVDGVTGVFFGPSDLAASLGYLGQQEHPEVVAAVSAGITRVKALGKAPGVNAFSEPLARQYIDLGCSYVVVGADIALLARGSETLAQRYR